MYGPVLYYDSYDSYYYYYIIRVLKCVFLSSYNPQLGVDAVHILDRFEEKKPDGARPTPHACVCVSVRAGITLVGRRGTEYYMVVIGALGIFNSVFDLTIIHI